LFFKSDHIIYYAGVLGLIIFMIMRSSVDINSRVSINESRAETELRAAGLSGELGIGTESLVIVATRKQDPEYYIHLRDSVLAATSLSPARANLATYPFTGWKVTLSRQAEVPGVFRTEYNFFDTLGRLYLFIDDHQRVRYALVHPDAEPVPTNTGPREFAEDLIFSHFNYTSLFYRFIPEETNVVGETGMMEFRYEKIARGTPGPEFLELVLDRVSAGGDTGYRFREFTAQYFNDESYSIPGRDNKFDLWNINLISYAVEIGVIFIVLLIGIRQIFKGRVEWRRGILLGLLFSVVYYSWKSLFLYTTYHRLFSAQLVFVDHVSNAVLGLIFGFYICIAYIAWESISRENNLKDTIAFDAFWNTRLFNVETGKTIISGYSVAGIILAIFSLGLYTFGAIYGQHDSMFNVFREPAGLLPSLTTGFNVWMTVVLLAFVNFGVVINYLRVRMKDIRIFLIAATLFVAVSFLLLTRFVTTTAGTGQEFLIYAAMGLPLVLGYLYYGLMSVIFTGWAMMLVIKLPPYLNSASTDITIHGSALFILFLIPLVHGFIAWLYGSRLPEDGIYVPEYEQKLAKQLRFEREFEIAKSSQHALMPKSAPVIPGIDVEGFFIPSFEVGGDFYDYSVQMNYDGTPEALAIVVADVSGKSIKAAFHAIFTSGLLLSRMKNDPPEEVLSRANPVLFQKTDSQTFITCQVCQYNISAKVLRISNAGHCPPLLKRGESVVQIELPAPRYPLGIRPAVDYKGLDVQLVSGDVVLLYSDGLPEAMNKKGQRIEFAGVNTMLREMNTSEMSPVEICSRIKKYILTYSDYELADDTTVVCLKVI
jgi:serine phosphatase RsbU (regulator of sigma subunit)